MLTGGLIDELQALPSDWALVPVDGKKAPYRPDWQNSPHTKAQVEQEIKSGRCKAVGVLCGVPSGGLLFLDHDGASATELIQSLSGGEKTPKTIGVTSGLPGRLQLIFRVPNEYWDAIATKKIKTGKVGSNGKPELLEFRWNGCQSVVIGKHPETGSYRWLPGRSPDETGVADAPMWMIEQMLGDAAPTTPFLDFDRPAQSLKPRWDVFCANFRLPIDDVVPLIECLTKDDRTLISMGADQGGRDDAGAKLARNLLGTAQYLSEIGQRYDGYPKALLEDYGRRCNPALPSTDIDRIWKSAERDRPSPTLAPEMIEGCIRGWKWREITGTHSVTNNPTTPTHRDVQNQSSESFQVPNTTLDLELTELMKQVESLREKESEAEKEFGLHRLSRLAKLSRSTIDSLWLKFKAEVKKFQPKDVCDFLATKLGSRRWIVAKFFTYGSTYVWFAEGGVGKTLLAYNLVRQVATGQPWLGSRSEKGKCLIIQTDEPEVDTQERLMVSKFLDVLPKGQVFLETSWTFEQVKQLKDWIGTYKPSLILIDSFTSANRNQIDEKDTGYGSVLYDLRDIANEYGCTFLILHHENKGGGIRGTTAIKDNVSEVVRLSRGGANDKLSKNERIFEVMKSRSGSFGRYLIELDPVDYSWALLGLLDENGRAIPMASQLSQQIMAFLSNNCHQTYSVGQLTKSFDHPVESLRMELEGLRRLGIIGGNSESGTNEDGSTYRYWRYYAFDNQQLPQSTERIVEEDDDVLEEF